MKRLVALLIWAAMSTAFAHASPSEVTTKPMRLALVIGNSDYDKNGKIDPPDRYPEGMQPDLPNAANDARKVAAALTSAKYDVSLKVDADYDGMLEAVSDFAAKLSRSPPDTVAIVYYAGHGLSVGGANFLIPVAAKLPPRSDFSQLPAETVQFNLRQRALSAEELLNVVSSDKRVTIVIIDACRNNPWSRRVRGLARGDPEVGLSRMEGAGSTIIGFSAQPGHTAEDGAGANSPFALAILDQLNREDASIFDIWIEIVNKVREATKQAQRPWISGSPATRVCIPGCAPTRPALARPPETRAEATEIEAPKPTFKLIRQIAWPLSLTPGEPSIVRVPTHSSNVLIFALIDMGSRGTERVNGKFSPSYGGAYVAINLPTDLNLSSVGVTVKVQEIGTRQEETVNRILKVQR